MVDNTLLAAKIAAIRDAAARIRDVLPADRSTFFVDRTAREVVLLNLFVAIQECMSLATHRLADEGLDVPPTYADVFRRLQGRTAKARRFGPGVPTVQHLQCSISTVVIVEAF